MSRERNLKFRYTSTNAGYRYSVLEAPPVLLAHVHLKGVWLGPVCVTLEIYIECRTTIEARAANKRDRTIAKTLFLNGGPIEISFSIFQQIINDPKLYLNYFLRINVHLAFLPI